MNLLNPEFQRIRYCQRLLPDLFQNKLRKIF